MKRGNPSWAEQWCRGVRKICWKKWGKSFPHDVGTGSMMSTKKNARLGWTQIKKWRVGFRAGRNRVAGAFAKFVGKMGKISPARLRDVVHDVREKKCTAGLDSDQKMMRGRPSLTEWGHRRVREICGKKAWKFSPA